MDEQELRGKLIDGAAHHVERSIDVADADEGRAHAESARALVEASTYLIPVQAPPSLSDGARIALRELLVMIEESEHGSGITGRQALGNRLISARAMPTTGLTLALVELRELAS